jgi:hypothetical protein
MQVSKGGNEVTFTHSKEQRFAYVGMLNLRATLGKVIALSSLNAAVCSYKQTKK